MKQEKIGNRSAFFRLASNVFFGVRTSFCASKRYFILRCLDLLFDTAVPLINIRLWKEILDGIFTQGKNSGAVFLCLGVYCALTFLLNVKWGFSNYIIECYYDELSLYLDRLQMEKTSRCDLSFYDQANLGDKARQVQQNSYVIRNMTWSLFRILAALSGIATTFVAVLLFNPWIALLTVVLLIPYAIVNARYNGRVLERETEQQRDFRKITYYSNVFRNPDYLSELRLNGLYAHFSDVRHRLWDTIFQKNEKEDFRYTRRSILLMIVGTLSYLATILLSAAAFLAGTLSIGGVQYNVSLVSRLRAQLENLISSLNLFLRNDERLTMIRDFIDLAPEKEKSGKKLPPSCPRIEFRHVTFRYPNAKEDVLRDCSFVIEPRKKIGLIGVNGSGKSTLIKLLFRFYDPQEGEILLNGTDIREYDVYALRASFSVLFQECVRYSLPLREIIALSDFAQCGNDEKLRAACRASGADEIIRDWEDGFDSVLGRVYVDNGRDLSGGQWQIVSLARAYFHDSEMIILDEPSASLDPITEDKIFEQLYRRESGKTSLTISHRLSNTVRADQILVIGDGKVLEKGSHEELLAQGGLYAHLFSLQADKYR